ncbi:UNVERIFIED_CONTAM: ABC transporter C family member 5 [Sesamum calycinum]|uniref:ABC transporter C family member 5 n=1 Tax=Sesamum calycinum TaxID=2727403 RepID=A0AAW2SFM2_9LAMI
MGINLFLAAETTASEAPPNHLQQNFHHIPILELASICINLTLLLVFLFVVSARQIVLCFGRIRLRKENSNRNSVASRHTGLVEGEGIRSLVIAQSLAWFVLSFSALYRKYKFAEKFPLLLRIWWVASFLICLCVLYVDARGFLAEGSSHFTSHVLANFAVTPALAFLCFIAIRGVTDIQVYRNSDLQEPLLEEEAGCLRVTPYSEAGLLSLVTLSWLNPLLSTGAKRPLELKDIPLLAPKDRSKTNYKALNSNWERLKAENP